MTGLEKMLLEIEDEAKASAQSAVKVAQQDADLIIEKAKVQGNEESIAISKQSEADVSDYLSRAKSAAALQKRKYILNAKQELINQVIEKAQQSIKELPEKEYFGMILKMIEKHALAQDGEIVFSPSDLKRLPSDFEAQINQAVAKKNAKLTISKQTQNIDGGFVLIYGGVEENCSISALFDAAREILQDKVHEILF
ncbi:MAG: V-type ATP synthase subunit E [Anaerofustis sp.]|jgi:V/A-type H+-transporting ATPase subunit E